MPRRVLVFAVIVLAGILVITGYRFARPLLRDWKQRQTSDSAATKGKITIAKDNWIGYFPLCSSEMKNRMRISGYVLECVDDEANYKERMERLKSGEINWAVATIDSYIKNAAHLDFPSVISMVIDESFGGDAILAQEHVAKNINAVRGQKNLRVAYTPDSPSHHLLKATADNFGVPELLPKKEPLRIETNGSSEALKKLLGKQADIAVLWEPDVSRALAQKGVVKLLGTEKTRQLIVDILLVNREYASHNSKEVETVLSTYFQVLKFYREHPNRLKDEVAKATHLSPETVEVMLKGVKWVNLSENYSQWFGINSTTHWLTETIESTVSILTNPEIGDFKRNPLPDSDPSRIVWGEFIKNVYAKGLGGFASVTSTDASGNSLSARFTPLSEAGWNALRPIGSLRIEPVTFRSGTADLELEGKEELDRVVKKVQHYPNFRIIIKGHSTTEGDYQANVDLSQERAESVARYLGITYSIDLNRMRSIGIGPREPLPRYPNESERAYEYRLRRVEIFLVSEVY